MSRGDDVDVLYVELVRIGERRGWIEIYRNGDGMTLNLFDGR